MQTQTIESVRWQDRPARVTAANENGDPRAWLQATAPLNIEAMCKGRLVEELPRILTILSPAHHLASAMALDRLFEVEPPELAVNMREALLQAEFLSGHLRKLHFLLTAFENPFDLLPPRRKGSNHVVLKMQEDVMRQLTLAQEASTILGGRSEHPLTAIAGGTSRFLKEELYGRLEEIAAASVELSVKTASFFTEKLFADPKLFKDYSEIGPGPMSGLCLKGRDVSDPENPKEGVIAVTGADGKEILRFSIEQAGEKIDLATEPWTYAPFAFFKDKGWKGLENGADSLYFVGPLARLNSGEAFSTPKAEEHRLKTIEDLGPLPLFTVTAAFRALVAETVHAAEKLADLCVEEKMTGASIREIPKTIGTEGHAALESPQGFIYHRYRVDEKGVVQDIRILDVSSENNALRCLLTQNVHKSAVARHDSWEKEKKQIEVSLLPF